MVRTSRTLGLPDQALHTDSTAQSTAPLRQSQLILRSETIPNTCIITGRPRAFTRPKRAPYHAVKVRRSLFNAHSMAGYCLRGRANLWWNGGDRSHGEGRTAGADSRP